jgi:erythrocyte band 7 integral membrane protein
MEEISFIPNKRLVESNNGNYQEPCFASFLRGLGCCFGFLCIPFSCGGCCYPYKSVNRGSKGVVQEFGSVRRTVGDGLHYVNPMTETLTRLDMRIQVMNLGGQHVMTQDKLSITIHSVIYYQVTDINNALFKIDDVKLSIVELAYATLRNVIGNSTLETCLSQREKLAGHIKEIVQNWGVSIISIQIKDIVVPTNIISALSSAVTAEREAQAKIITAEADVRAAELMRRAADVLNTPAAMQIRSLEVIDRLAHSQNAKLILLPSDLNLQSTLRNNLVTHTIAGE